MNQARIVQKGNDKESGFDVRIIESDCQSYYYHFIQFEDSESAIEAIQPFNFKSVANIAWNDVPLKVKEAHYKNLYPNDTLNDYDKKCFFYGKQQTDEEIAAEEEKANQRREFIHKVVYEDKVCDYFMAGVIYDSIGKWNSFQVIYERNGKGNFCVDDKIITVERWRVVSIEDKADYNKKRKNWGIRVGEIAREAGTSFDFATAIGNITEKEKAVKILKRIYDELNAEEFYLFMNSIYSDYNTDEWSLKDGIRSFLYRRNVSSEYTKHINYSNKFCNAVKGILNKK